ncbi:hypothetical protein QUF55_06860 [Clostridiaceae bacterium HSG29]|nr:hypothetical protein [Clostridiaceae bacterium HSG29]
MHKLVSSMDKEKTFTEIKKSIIEFDAFKQYMFGFIGKTNYDLRSFWIVNQSNIYKREPHHPNKIFGWSFFSRLRIRCSSIVLA